MRMSISALPSRTSGRLPTGMGCGFEPKRAGRTESLRLGISIGADGPRSVVRQCLGVGVRVDRGGAAFVLSGRAGALVDVVGRHRYGIYVTEKPAPGTFLPAGQVDRWVYAFSWDPRIEAAG